MPLNQRLGACTNYDSTPLTIPLRRPSHPMEVIKVYYQCTPLLKPQHSSPLSKMHRTQRRDLLITLELPCYPCSLILFSDSLLFFFLVSISVKLRQYFLNYLSLSGNIIDSFHFIMSIKSNNYKF